LTKRGRTHLVLERHRIAERWRSERWDGLRFQSPNWAVGLPDFPFPHADPDEFASAQEIADFIIAYANFIAAPVRCGIEVTVLRQRDRAPGFTAQTTGGMIEAANVVVATGPFQRPVFPALFPDGAGIFQVHARNYRNPDQLPPGAILVVGAGASGTQIAEELRLAGRPVYLSVGGHQRLPRRYRGHDFVWWLGKTGRGRTAVEARGPDLSPNLITGAYGGYTIDFRHLAAQGVILLGRVRSALDGVVTAAPDLADSVTSGDAAYLVFCDEVDAYLDLHGLDVPQDSEARAIPPARATLPEPLLQLNLAVAGVAAIVWATGYGFDFSWIDIPVLDERGVPRHRHGVTGVVGLYFLGLEWLTRKTSARLVGVGEDAALLADHIAARAGGV